MDHKYPPGYGRYMFSHSDDASPDHKAIIKFAARYRFAGQLESIQAHGYGDKTVAIYTETLRISLAYSAFEQLIKIGGLSGIASVKIPSAAAKFRSSSFTKLRAQVLQANDPSLRDQIQRLVDSRSASDMLPVIKSIRHGMFHGVLTPGSLGTSSAVKSFLDLLSQGLFAEMDRLFVLYLAARAKDN
jgi:hypothetical protein